MKRYNIFNNIHKGLRVCLYEESIAVLHCDFSDIFQAERTGKRITAVMNFFEKHAHTEDSLVFPLLAEYEPAVVTVFNGEHVEDHALSANLQNLVGQLYAAGTAEERTAAGEKISKAFIEFMIFNLKHMAKEESILNEIFWRYYTDEQLLGITKNIVAAQGKEDIIISSRWMVRGLNAPELIQWFRGIKASAPDAQFRGMMNLAEAELDGGRWDALSAALCEGAMVA